MESFEPTPSFLRSSSSVLLFERRVHARKRHAAISMEGYLIGTCTAFCPLAEAEERRASRFLSACECPPLRPLVKRYTRPTTAASIAAADVRPLPVLRRVVSYLLDDVWTWSDVSFHERCAFISDRLRAVRQDMSVQALRCDESLLLLCRMARYHAASGAAAQHMASSDASAAASSQLGDSGAKHAAERCAQVLAQAADIWMCNDALLRSCAPERCTLVEELVVEAYSASCALVLASGSEHDPALPKLLRDIVTRFGGTLRHPLAAATLACIRAWHARHTHAFLRQLAAVEELTACAGAATVAYLLQPLAVEARARLIASFAAAVAARRTAPALAVARCLLLPPCAATYSVPSRITATHVDAAAQPAAALHAALWCEAAGMTVRFPEQGAADACVPPADLRARWHAAEGGASEFEPLVQFKPGAAATPTHAAALAAGRVHAA
ncbi:hypothetical protein EON68_00895 [archaeon]|nr:MAG: hypothetical protein EON68_00895 [archaeon]